VPTDSELQLRGRLARRLGALREMLPGSFVERQRACGKPNAAVRTASISTPNTSSPSCGRGS
jgi:hypothetical protein